MRVFAGKETFIYKIKIKVKNNLRSPASNITLYIYSCIHDQKNKKSNIPSRSFVKLVQSKVVCQAVRLQELSEMLSLGPPSSSFYAERMPFINTPLSSERMPFTNTPLSSSFAFRPWNNINQRSNVPNEAAAANTTATRGLYSNLPPRTLRPPSQISKLCPFPYRKEKEDERRRQAFLRKVRDVGDARKWEQRGDTVRKIYN